MSGLAGRLRRVAREALDRVAPPPVLIGHSHTRAIFKAAAARGLRLKGYDFWTAPQPAVDAARTAFHPDIARTLAHGPVFSAVGGTAHAMVSLVAHPRPFDVVLPEDPDLPMAAGAEVLPVEALRGALAAVLQEYLDLMRLVRATARGPVFHIAAPPVPEDERRILPDVPWMFFPGLTREVGPASLRYKCWRLHAQLVEAFCAREGIAVIPPPAEAIGARGYLAPGYYADAMHVNEAYGALVVEQIRRRL